MKKYLRPEQLADLFLKHLFHNRKVGSSALSTFFSGREIYVDGQLADEIIELLSSRKLMKPVDGSLDMLAFANENVNPKVGPMQPAHFLDGFAVEGTYPHFEITPRGMAFIFHDERVDTQGINEDKEDHKKWKDRLINIGVAVVTAFLILLMTEPMKRRFEKDTKTRSQQASVSSPVRPRVEARQGPEPVKLIDTSAQRSRASR